MSFTFKHPKFYKQFKRDNRNKKIKQHHSTPFNTTEHNTYNSIDQKNQKNKDTPKELSEIKNK